MIFAKSSLRSTSNFSSSPRSQQPKEENEATLKNRLLRLFCFITAGVGLATIGGLAVNVLVAHEFLPASWLTLIIVTGIAFLNYGLATLQQDSASHQVLNAVPGLNTVAVQNAQGSAYISGAALNLEEMSHNLTRMLLL